VIHYRNTGLHHC